jgi:hypothetical protein
MECADACLEYNPTSWNITLGRQLSSSSYGLPGKNFAEDNVQQWWQQQHRRNKFQAYPFLYGIEKCPDPPLE